MKKLEIERRYLVLEYDRVFINSLLKSSQITHIKQGYFELPDTDTTFRVRESLDRGERIKSSITIKKRRDSSGLARTEDKHKITIPMGRSLMDICHHYLHKTRIETPYNWELNLYKEPLEGIATAELEFNSVAKKIQLPKWIWKATEVTGILTDLHLARLASELRGTREPVALDRDLGIAVNKVPVIGLLGSPASGKDGMIAELEEEMPNVHFVPEVASILMSRLKVYPSKDRVLNRRFQRAVYQTQKIFEGTALQLAKPYEKEAIVVNRATLCNAAFFEGGYEELSSFLRTNLETEYAKYDFIIFLDKPPRKVFEKKRGNNQARYEKTYEDVCTQHEKLMELWKDHPNLVFVKSYKNWQVKVSKVRQTLKEIIQDWRNKNATELA